MTVIEFSLPKYLEFLDEWAAVKDVEPLPGNQDHAAQNKGRKPLRSDSSRYSSPALRASQCGKAKQLSLKEKLGKVFSARIKK